MASSCTYQTPSCIDLHSSHGIGATGRDDRQAIHHIPEPMLDKTRKHRHHPSNKWFQLISGSAINRHCVGLDLRLLNKNFPCASPPLCTLASDLLMAAEGVCRRVRGSVSPCPLFQPSCLVRVCRACPCAASAGSRPPGGHARQRSTSGLPGGASTQLLTPFLPPAPRRLS